MTRALAVLLFLLLSLPAAARQRPVLVLQNGHTDAVVSVDVEGDVAATASWDGTVKLWDVPSARVLATLECGAGRLVSVTLGPRYLAVAPLDGAVQVWDARSATRVRTLAGSAASVALSPNGRLLACARRSGTVDLASMADGRVVRSLPARARDVAWSADGTLLAAGSDDWTVRIFEARGGRLVRTVTWRGRQYADVDPPLQAAFVGGGSGRGGTGAPGTQALAVSSAGHDEVRLYDLRTGRWTMAASHGAQSLSSHGDRLASVLDSSASEVLDLCTRRAHRIEGSAQVAFSGDGRWLAVGSYQAEAFVYSGNHRVATLVGRSSGVTSVALDDTALAAASRDGAAVLWDLTDGLLAFSHRFAGMATGVALSSTSLAASGPEVRVWDRRGGTPRQVHKGAAEGLAFSPDGSLLASAGADGVVHVWRGGKPLTTLDADSLVLEAVAFSPDATAVAASTSDGLTLVRLDEGPTAAPAERPRVIARRHWDVAGGDLRPCFGPDGTILAAPDALWEVADRRVILPMPEGTSCVALSGDGRLLAAGGRDLTVRALEGDGQARVFRGHTHVLTSLAFGPGGRVLASGSADSTVRLWDVAGGRLLATLVSFDGGEDWAAVSPEGFFDGSAGGLRLLEWRVGDRLLALEQYFAEFYQPGLVSDVFRHARPMSDILRERDDPRASLRIEQRDRRLPRVVLTAPKRSERRVARVRLEVTPGARDLRLFRDGVLVRRWDGAAPGVVTADVRLHAGPNVLTAYAFNKDDVKSRDASATVVGAPGIARAGRTLLLAIGINDYADRDDDLEFAVADARATARALPGADTTLLLDGDATRDGIEGALRRLGEEAGPEDTVIISYSGHGRVVGERFVLIPSDGQGIDDLALERLLLPVQAARIALVLDACESGGALDADEPRRGPLNARGLAQLAWEKGMDVIAAAQSRQSAVEVASIGDRRIGQGLLHYALFTEGLAPGRDVREWFAYAARRVPELSAYRARKTRPAQTPRVFHRREGGGRWKLPI